MIRALECFTKRHQMYQGNKLKLNSQRAPTTAKTFNKFIHGIIKFFQDISSGFKRLQRDPNPQPHRTYSRVF